MEELVRRWIRAEFQFRYGDNCYSKTTQSWLLDAEDRLRRRVTGKGELGRAGKKLGCKSRKPASMKPWDPREHSQEASKPIKKLQRKQLIPKKKRSNSLRIGLFE